MNRLWDWWHQRTHLHAALVHANVPTISILVCTPKRGSTEGTHCYLVLQEPFKTVYVLDHKNEAQMTDVGKADSVQEMAQVILRHNLVRKTT